MSSTIFWSFARTEAGASPIEYSDRPGLAIVPYVRRRLVFAQAAAAALETRRFDRLVVDLPRFLGQGELLELSHSGLPLLHTLFVRKNTDEHLLLPLVPNDAGYIASYAARRNRVPYECADAEDLPFRPEGTIFSPDLPLRDDFFAHLEGLERYFTPLWSRMDALWEEIPPIRKAFTAARASLVAARLNEAMASGGRTLFVCEYRLWWAVRKILEKTLPAGMPSFASPQADFQVAFLAEDPYSLWTMGFLDDFPCINLKFLDALKKGKTKSFNKLEALECALFDLLHKDDPRVSNGRSVRRLLALARYLKARTVASERVVPLPSSHLFDAAEACIGKEFSRELARTLLEYPRPDIKCGEESGGFYSWNADGTFCEGAAFEIPDILETADYYGNESSGVSGAPSGLEDVDRAYWADIARNSLTRAEARYLNGSSIGITWAIKEDYIFHQNACALIRENIVRAGRRTVVKRSWGSLGDGIHWKATIRAKALRERTLYIRKPRRDTLTIPIDEYTPHVFLLSDRIEGCAFSVIHDANIAQRNINLGNHSFPFEKHPPPDSVYSLFKAVGRLEASLDGHVHREWNKALAFLYTRSHMGVERYDAITRKPARCQCRQTPFEDPELAEYSPEEKFVAWPIKYAERAVIVVAHPGWHLPEKLARYARERNVTVIHVSLSTLSPQLVRRLQVTHFISTALKKYPAADKILRRFAV